MRKKNKKSAFHQNKAIMTDRKIKAMGVIDSFEYLKLLKDSETGMYVVFSNYTLNTVRARDYHTARNFFETEVNKL